MKKWQIGKKKMLGFLTAGAIVVTMAGSYAVWDQLSATSTGTVTLRKPITVTAAATTYKSDTAWDQLPVYTSDDIHINAENVPTGTKTKLELSAKVYEGDTQTEATGITAVIKEKDGTDSVTETSFADETAAATGKDYTVTVTPNDDTVDTSINYRVELTGKLIKDTTP